MFLIWHRYKSGEIPWQTFRSEMQPVRDTVNSLLLRGQFSGNILHAVRNEAGSKR
jgi:hypothetical protein